MSSWKYLSIVCLSLGFLVLPARSDTVRLASRSSHPYLAPDELIAASFARQEVDTVYVMGGPGDWSGRFENPDGTANWHGWTHEDATAPEGFHWHGSTYNGTATGAEPGPDNHVAYCGDETIDACSFPDVEGGYGNSWIDRLDWSGTAPDPSAPTVVQLDYYISYDVEPGYDFVYLNVDRDGGMASEEVYNGHGENVHEQILFTVNPADYAGADQDQIHLRFEFTSDAAWSDEDCLWPTEGACQIDDIEIRLNGEISTFDDFEGSDLGSWETVSATGVGDFAQLMHELEDLDPCVDNYSWQVVFVDDGIVVPGTGGTECITWCYGPDGWIVNNTGGLVGPDAHIHNLVLSPVLEWPAGGYTGGELRFDVYEHEELGDMEIWPGIVHASAVRSVDTSDPADIEEAPWRHPGSWGWYPSPRYTRHVQNFRDWILPAATHVQVALECIEIGYFFGWVGTDGTPAPYFDNVAVVAFPIEQPLISLIYSWRAKDAFPERGSLDLLNLQVNWCRFDRGFQDIDADYDRLEFEAESLRPGGELTGHPRLHYLIKTNPLFNDVRGEELGTPDAAGFIRGSVAADSLRNAGGVPQSGEWSVDLPDTGHFYPGDVLHYYFWAEDAVDGLDPRTSTVPVDTVGFSDFSSDLTYDGKYVWRGLPSLASAQPGDQPRILLVEDNSSGRPEWRFALRHLGLLAGYDYDVLRNQNQFDYLSRSATPVLLNGYDVLLYSGLTGIGTIRSPYDTELLSGWFELGGKNAFFTANDLAFDLSEHSPAFLHTWLGIDYVVGNVRPYIENQPSPLVVPTLENPIFSPDTGGWIAFGGCPYNAVFDGVWLLGNTVAIAEFTNPQGYPGGYSFPAATYRHDTERDNRIAYLPYDLIFASTPRNGDGKRNDPAPLAARTILLRDVLLSFGVAPGLAVDVPGAADVFAANCHPNPFNPRTSIGFTLPRAGEVTAKIYDLRGACVRTLAAGELFEAGANALIWTGDDDRGARVASGVYFWELRFGGETRIGKVAMVK